MLPFGKPRPVSPEAPDPMKLLHELAHKVEVQQRRIELLEAHNRNNTQHFAAAAEAAHPSPKKKHRQTEW
jgi:hypothetical protein